MKSIHLSFTSIQSRRAPSTALRLKAVVLVLLTRRLATNVGLTNWLAQRQLENTWPCNCVVVASTNVICVPSVRAIVVFPLASVALANAMAA